jgi:hypothetical protein
MGFIGAQMLSKEKCWVEQFTDSLKEDQGELTWMDRIRKQGILGQAWLLGG